jgi:hypothetical protein
MVDTVKGTPNEVFQKIKIDLNPGDDHNLGEIEFMLENERKKFK